MNQSKLYFDIVFAGFGASSCLLIHSLHKKDLLSGKSILILDPQEKKTNDKTFCFWAKSTDTIIQDYQDLINHKWDKVAFNNMKAKSVAPLNYHHISCEKLYDATRKILHQYEVQFVHESILELSEKENLTLITENHEFNAVKVYDSRTPNISKSINPSQNIWQSFLGYKVTLKEDLFDSDSCTLMDFDVDQGNYTQFMYILPFSKNEALIEFTRFGKELIEEDYARSTLDTYIHKRFGEFSINEIERGKIPMFMDLPSYNPTKRITPIGSRASKVKPSTGYAFKNMYEHAESIASNNEKLTKSASKRFQFYDALLIYILSVWPKWGKTIFERLFSVRSTLFIFDFLDEKTTIRQEISMFSKLHIGKFLKALLYLIVQKLKLVAPVLILTLLYFALQLFWPSYSNYVMYGILALGLILIGIPHGAMDHKTGTLNTNKKINFSFVIRYLSIMALVYLFWLVSPTLSLIAFIIYSAWHFGQTDSEEWQINNNYVGFLWGIIFFTALLSSHLTELNVILGALNIAVIDHSLVVYFLFYGSISVAVYFSLKYSNLSWFVLASFLFFASNLPLIMAFLIYFVSHHSLNGWNHLKKSMNETNLNLFKQALPFNIGAMLLFTFFFLNTGENVNYNLAMAFVFISCISLPHIWCMHFFYKNRVGTTQK